MNHLAGLMVGHLRKIAYPLQRDRASTPMLLRRDPRRLAPVRRKNARTLPPVSHEKENAMTTITGPTRIAPGYYDGTITIDGGTYRYVIERQGPDSTTYREDFGWWSLDVDGDRGEPIHRTYRDAKAALLAADWYIDPTYGLCAR